MAWQLTMAELVDGVARQRERVEERPSWSQLELLARGLRWVDEVDESRRLFHDAAVDVIERIVQPGRGSGDTSARIAGFFALAEEPEQAREWGLRPVDTLLKQHSVRVADARLLQRSARGLERFMRPPMLDDEDWVRQEVSEAVATLYACGEADRALTLAREHGVQPLAVDLIEAERAGDASRCEATISRLVKGFVAGRFGPFESNGSPPLDPWDWLELAFLVRARIAGEPPPSHAEMLEQAGLLAPGPPRRRVTRVEPGAIERFAVTAADGTPVEAVIDRSNPDWVDVVLDPRHPEPRYLALAFEWTDDQGYGTRLYTDPLSSPQAVLPYEGRDFHEAVDAAADWLDGDDDVWGRDGTWAARTLRHITQGLPVSER